MKRGWKIGAAVLALLLAGGWCARFLYLNHRYPQAVVETYQTGEEIDYDGFAFTIHGYRPVQEAELTELGCTYTPETEDTDIQVKGIFVDVTIRNTGAETREFPLYIFNLEYDDWTTGMDLEWLGYVNAFGANVSLEPGEERDFVVPYGISDVQFPEKIWEQTDHLPYRIIFSLYPENRMVQL